VLTHLAFRRALRKVAYMLIRQAAVQQLPGVSFSLLLHTSFPATVTFLPAGPAATLFEYAPKG
jgi:hypothetical protein